MEASHSVPTMYHHTMPGMLRDPVLGICKLGTWLLRLAGCHCIQDCEDCESYTTPLDTYLVQECAIKLKLQIIS